MTASQSSYCEDIKGREFEAIRSEDCSLEANRFKGTRLHRKAMCASLGAGNYAV